MDKLPVDHDTPATQADTSEAYKRFCQRRKEIEQFRDDGIITADECTAMVRDALKGAYGATTEASTHHTAYHTDDVALQKWLTLHSESMLQPWKLVRRKILDYGDAFRTKGSAEEERLFMKKQFVEYAKTGALTPMEVMIGQYVFLGTDLHTIRTNLFPLLVGVPAEMRVPLHNWWIHSLWPEALQEVHGATVESLALPLFPPDALDEMNAKLLKVAASMQGGGEEQDPFATLYDLRRENGVLHGGAYTEAVVDASGQQVAAVNMEGTDARFVEMQRMLRELAAVVGRSQNRTRAPAPRRNYAPPAPQRRYERPPWRGGDAPEDAPEPAKN